MFDILFTTFSRVAWNTAEFALNVCDTAPNLFRISCVEAENGAKLFWPELGAVGGNCVDGISMDAFCENELAFGSKDCSALWFVSGGKGG